MKTLDEFKERILNDKEFIKRFENAETKNDVLKIASKNGYDFTNSELKSKELNNMLEQIAAGTDVHSYSHRTIVTGDDMSIFKQKGYTGGSFDDWISKEYLNGKSFDEWLEEQL